MEKCKAALSNAKKRIIAVEAENRELSERLFRQENLYRELLAEKTREIRKYEQQLERVREADDSLSRLLIQACEDGDLRRATQCLELGADVNRSSDSGIALLAALSHPCQRTQYRLLQTLLKVRNIDVNLVDHLGTTPLMRACQTGNLAAVRLLCLSPGLDVNLSNKLGSTALILAVRNNNLDIVNFFRTKVPDMDWNKNSPILDAVLQGNADMLSIFLEVPDILLTDLPGTFNSVSAAAVKAEEGDVVGCVELLSRDDRVSWTEPSLETESGTRTSPLSFALEHHKTEILKSLLRAPHVSLSSVSRPGQLEVVRDLVLETRREALARLSSVPQCGVCSGPLQAGVYHCLEGHLFCLQCHSQSHLQCKVCHQDIAGKAHGAQQFVQQFSQ